MAPTVMMMSSGSARASFVLNALWKLQRPTERIKLPKERWIHVGLRVQHKLVFPPGLECFYHEARGMMSDQHRHCKS